MQTWYPPDQVPTDLLEEGGRSREWQSPFPLLCPGAGASGKHGLVVHPQTQEMASREVTPATAATALPVPHKNQLLWAVLSSANPLLCTALSKPLPPSKGQLSQGSL